MKGDPVDHTQLVKAMSEPSFYPHPVEEVRFLQTHISSVFLTGEYVYKLKKPVNFGFLDFSTLELRKLYCRAEVELNSRLAPEIYLRAAPITFDGEHLALDGEGEVVDWVVVMRELDEQQLGTQVNARGELTAQHMDALVDVLVPFYSNAATGEAVDRYGKIEVCEVQYRRKFPPDRESTSGSSFSRDRFDYIVNWTNAFFKDQRDFFRRRIAEGRIRESHGDLHLGNIFFEEPPVIFDCIEFNERFRCGDVAVDLAFLAMDLDFNGRPDLAQHFVERYVEVSGDGELLELLNFYKCYRAYVRAKIACFTSVDPALDDTAKASRGTSRGATSASPTAMPEAPTNRHWWFCTA